MTRKEIRIGNASFTAILFPTLHNLCLYTMSNKGHQDETMKA